MSKARARRQRLAWRNPEKIKWPMIVVALVVALTGCGHPHGVMAPVVSVAPNKSTTVDMLVATSRQPSGDPNTLFNGERSPRIHLTEVSVSIPQNRAVGTVQWPKKIPADPKTEFAVTSVTPISDVAQGRTWVRKHSRNGSVLVFIHGFNNRFEDSVFRFAQIAHDSGADVTPVLFTWPSRASLVQYEYDKESTNYSRTALEQGLRLLAEDPQIKDITILAHSMGTWLTVEALRQMGIRDGKVNPKIKNLILASPDLDIDVFAKQYVEMGTRKPQTTIFVSQDDRALAVSRLISGDVNRLGEIDPTAEPYRSKLEKAGINAIDLTKVKTDDSLHHGKFAESPEIVQLIGTRLVNGQTLTDSNVTLGDGITAVVGGTVRGVGTVAATTVAAPVKILEQGTPKRTSSSMAETLQTGAAEF